MSKIPSHKEIINKMMGVNKNDIFINLVANFLSQFAETLKTPPPTNEELLTLIEPLIPKTKKLDSPTKEEIAVMVLDLIGKEDKKESISKKDIISIVKENIISKKDIVDIVKTNLPEKPKDNSKELEKQIKELKDKLEKLLEKKRTTVSGGKPGGMGDPQHESFDINIGTTTITTAYPIAADGTAILNFHYQNTQLFIGTHYTVGGNNRTITFDSAVSAQFEDNMKAEITYIR